MMNIGGPNQAPQGSGQSESEEEGSSQWTVESPKETVLSLRAGKRGTEPALGMALNATTEHRTCCVPVGFSNAEGCCNGGPCGHDGGSKAKQERERQGGERQRHRESWCT